MSSHKDKEKAYSSMNNLLYGLRRLYRISPIFIWSYFLGIPLAIGISLLGVYMPSVLVADITAEAQISTILLHLGLWGGGLVFLYGFQSWITNTQALMGIKMRYEGSLRLAKEAMNADYDKIESADFETEIWQLNSLHLWSGTYSIDFMQSFIDAAAAVIGMVLYTGMLSGLSVWLILLVIISGYKSFASFPSGKSGIGWECGYTETAGSHTVGGYRGSHLEAAGRNAYNVRPWSLRGCRRVFRR